MHRDDLDYGVIHVPRYYGMAAAAAAAPLRFAKVPGISWEEFGQHLLAELRRLDEEDSQHESDESP